jgi:hypothetical protein
VVLTNCWCVLLLLSFIQILLVRLVSTLIMPSSVRFIHSFIHSSMALQLFVGSLPLLQFRNIF